MNHKNTPEGFYAKVDKDGPNGCWSWLGSTNKLGYGQLGYQGRRMTAHRLSYELNKGAIPEGQIVRHDCDNPNCCNPDHLRLGTHQDNADDRKSRGRKRGPAGAPSINPRFKTVGEREMERYGACGRGHTLAPNNIRVTDSGESVCEACFWMERFEARDRVATIPQTEEEKQAIAAFKAHTAALLESLHSDFRPRIVVELVAILNETMRTTFHI